jgi:hypothetical protein
VALPVFGVTYSTLRSLRFPHWNAFSTRSSFTDTDVTSIIQEEAADLAGRLYAEDITAADIDANDNAIAYLWCAKTLHLMAACRILRDVTANEPALAQAYQRELDARLALLASQGATALGDESLSTGTSDPDGPTSHISQFSLETDEAENMSTTVPRLRRDDQL